MRYFIFRLFILIAACAPAAGKRAHFQTMDFGLYGDFGRCSLKSDSSGDCFVEKKKLSDSSYEYYQAFITPIYFNKLDSLILQIEHSHLDTLYADQEEDNVRYKIIFSDSSKNYHYTVRSHIVPESLDSIYRLISYITEYAPLTKIDTSINFESQKGFLMGPPLPIK